MSKAKLLEEMWRLSLSTQKHNGYWNGGYRTRHVHHPDPEAVGRNRWYRCGNIVRRLAAGYLGVPAETLSVWATRGKTGIRVCNKQQDEILVMYMDDPLLLIDMRDRP